MDRVAPPCWHRLDGPRGGAVRSTYCMSPSNSYYLSGQTGERSCQIRSAQCWGAKIDLVQPSSVPPRLIEYLSGIKGSLVYVPGVARYSNVCCPRRPQASPGHHPPLCLACCRLCWLKPADAVFPLSLLAGNGTLVLGLPLTWARTLPCAAWLRSGVLMKTPLLIQFCF